MNVGDRRPYGLTIHADEPVTALGIGSGRGTDLRRDVRQGLRVATNTGIRRSVALWYSA